MDAAAPPALEAEVVVGVEEEDEGLLRPPQASHYRWVETEREEDHVVPESKKRNRKRTVSQSIQLSHASRSCASFFQKPSTRTYREKRKGPTFIMLGRLISEQSPHCHSSSPPPPPSTSSSSLATPQHSHCV